MGKNVDQTETKQKNRCYIFCPLLETLREYFTIVKYGETYALK